MNNPIKADEEKIEKIVLVECFLCRFNLVTGRVPVINFHEAYPASFIQSTQAPPAFEIKPQSVQVYLCKQHYHQQAEEGVLINE